MPKRILIVDDELAITEMLEQALMDEGYSVRKTTQSLRFYDEVREYHPDVVLLDLMMPYLDGEDELRLMSLEPATSDIPVIMITGKPDANDREEEFRAIGVRKIFIKPVDLNDLLKAIHDIIGDANA
jgi:two-component system, OmpR family, response regulator VicR